MAKKINAGETPRTEDDNIPVSEGPVETVPETGVASGVPENNGTTGAAATGAPAKDGNDGMAGTTDPHLLELLKKFPAYPALFIDTHGGTYTPDTAAVIRGKAVLYRNPFYHELKTKA